jgi:hypothetical protein
MENFYLESTPKTPRLSFNNDNGIFEVSGRSIPENSIEFYKPLLDWLDTYVKEAKAETKLIVKLEYFNTSSSKCLVEIFRKLEKLQKENKVVIQWFYDEEDEDMQESGEDFKEIIKIPIEMIVLKDGE